MKRKKGKGGRQGRRKEKRKLLLVISTFEKQSNDTHKCRLELAVTLRGPGSFYRRMSAASNHAFVHRFGEVSIKARRQ